MGLPFISFTGKGAESMRKWKRRKKEPETIGGMLRRKRSRNYILLASANIVIIGLLVWQLWSFKERMDQLDNQLTYLMDTNSTIQGDVSGMQSNIQAKLDEEASLLSNYSIETTAVDFNAGTYDVEFHVTPKEYTDETQVVVYFGTTEYHLQKGSKDFEGSATLSFLNSYDGNVTFLFINGEKKSTEVLKNYVGYPHAFEDVLYGNLGEFPEYKDGKLKIGGETQFTLQGNDTFQFESCDIVVKAGTDDIYRGNLLNGEVLLKPADDTADDHADQDNNNGDSSPENNAADSAEQVIEPATENAGTEESGPISNTDGTYTITDALQVAQDTKVQIRLEAKTTDGFTFDYVIFEGKTAQADPQKPDTAVDGWQESEDYLPYTYTVTDPNGAVRTFGN